MSQEESDLLSRLQEQYPDAAIRLQMGRRVIQGTLNSGEERNELTPDREELFNDAINQPVAPDIKPEAYQGKVPDLQISVDGEVVFRQERGGIVSKNLLLSQPEQSSEAAVTTDLDTQLPVVELPDTATCPSPVPTLQDVQDLVDPLQQKQAIATQLDKFQFQPNEDCSAITVAEAQTGSALAVYTTHQSAPVICETPGFDQFCQWAESSLGSNNRVELEATVVSTPYLLSPAEAAPDQDSVPGAIAVAQNQLAGHRFFSRVVQDLQEQAAALSEKAQAGMEIAQAGAEKVQAGMEALHEKFNSPEFQDLKQQVVDRSQADITTTKQAIADGLEKLGQGLEKAGQWLASRADAIHEQQAARAALDLFERGRANARTTVSKRQRLYGCTSRTESLYGFGF